jgi:5-hydroxyisourate hydrolase
MRQEPDVTTLSTHVLDVSRGHPAAAVPLRLWQGDLLLLEAVTNPDGRCPALAALTLDGGLYRLEFAVAAYFRAAGDILPAPPFLDRITLEFGVSDAAGHTHVPLLVSPFGYTTYRGS